MQISDSVAKFLEERGFDLETVALKTGIYSVSRPGGDPDANGDWMAIPFVKRGKVVNRKYRSAREKKFSQDAGGSQIFFNRDVIADPTLKDFPLIITEGEMDAIAAICSGFSRVVSVPGGAPAEVGTAKHECVDEAWNDLKDVSEIIIATDNDEPGTNLRDDLVGRLGPARCKIVRYPRGCKDLNDALMSYGVRGVRESIERAQYVPTDGVYILDDIPESPPLAPVRVDTMGDDFYKHIAICKGQVSFWTGWANRGKTTVLKQVMVDLVRQRFWRIGAAMFEDDIRRTLVPDLEVLYSGKPHTQLKNDDRLEAQSWIKDHFRFIVPSDDTQATVPWFLERAEECIYRHNCEMIILDPWTEIDLELNGRSENEVVKNYLSAFTRFAKRFNVHVAIIAHPRKPPEIGGSKKLPTGYDISGSAHFFNKCHLGVTIQSHETVDGLTEVKVWKSKFKDIMGPTGSFYMLFDQPTKRFSGVHKSTAIKMVEVAA